MATNDLIFRKNQAAIESTRGTDLAATRLVYANITPSYERPLREFQDNSGTFETRRRLAYQRDRVTFSASELLTFEDIAWWGQLAWKGGVTGGAGDGGTPEMFTYTFTPTLATDDLKSITLEWNEPGNPYQSNQVMVNSWTIRIDPDNEGGWLGDFEMLALNIATTSYTGSISDRTTEVIPAPGTKLYIDDTTIGSTQATGKFISASITGNNNIHYKAFGENVSGFAANKVGRGARTVDAQIVMEFDNDTEFAKFRAASGTQRFVRISSDGAVIHDAVVSNVQLNMNGYWSTIGWGDREGNIIATFGLSCFYNASSGYAFNAVVKNDVETLA